MNPADRYWKKLFGVELFKVRYFLKWALYKGLGVTLPKLKDQRNYWRDRGQVYMHEMFAMGYLEREVFFQDLLIDFLRTVPFGSFFEAGCGFGWNIRRVKEEFPGVRVGGIDFSATQLENGREYLKGLDIQTVEGDVCRMPFADGQFDIGFSLGVFMNLHPDKIEAAAREMTRVCRKYIVHIEYDQNQTTPELREKRAFKTNIVSHDYRRIYESLGKSVAQFRTFRDFGDAYRAHEKGIATELKRWEGFEGPEKYIFIVVAV